MNIFEYQNILNSILLIGPCHASLKRWRDRFDGPIYCTASNSDFFPLNSFSASIAPESKPGTGQKIGKVKLKWLNHKMWSLANNFHKRVTFF